MTNRFPLPWSVEELEGRFVVRDKNGKALSNVCFANGPERLLFTRDVARYLATNLSELPQLLRQTVAY